jgi:lipopolysaccharide transport system permease protein
MISSAINPLCIIRSFWANRYILGQLVKRDVLLRYRGAMFGVAWMFLNPLLMLAIFIVVFGQVFQARWQQQASIPYWLLLYVGLIIFNLFAEPVGRAPATVRGHPSYVKKIVFPVEILPLVPLCAGLIHTIFNGLILTIALAWTGHLSPSLMLLPMLVIPVLLLGMGLAWFLAAWGVFIKDMSQIIPLFIQMLLFLSPVFYPASAVPQTLQPLYDINPLGTVIEAARAAVAGLPICWSAWGLSLGSGLAVALLGLVFFNHSRDEFADAL